MRRRAEEIVDLADKTEKELTERDELINGVVSVGCGELASVQVIVELFRAFKEKYPAVTYELYAGNADYTNERIEKGLSDIALFLEPVDAENYRRHESFQRKADYSDYVHERYLSRSGCE